MSDKAQPSRYEAFACGNCHPDRYTVFTTRTRLGAKRWGIRDNHMDIKLTKLCKSLEAAETWRMALARMELRERQHVNELRRLGQPATRTTDR